MIVDIAIGPRPCGSFGIEVLGDLAGSVDDYPFPARFLKNVHHRLVPRPQTSIMISGATNAAAIPIMIRMSVMFGVLG